MVRQHLKLYLFILISAVIAFFLFGEQLLHPKPPSSIKIPEKPKNHNTTYNEYTEVKHHIEGNIVFGTVLKSAENAKTTVLSLANRLIEGFKVKDAPDKLTLAVFDVFGVIDDLEMDMVEDEKKIKILIFPMKKSYDPCLLLTKDEWGSSGWRSLLNSRLLSLYTADFIAELRKSLEGNKGSYFHLLYNTVNLKSEWNTFIPGEEMTITPFGSTGNQVAGFMMPKADLNKIEKNTREKVFSTPSVKDILTQELSVLASKQLDLVRGDIVEDTFKVPIDREFHDCVVRLPMPWPQPTLITHNKANEDTRVIVSPELSFVVNDELLATANIPDWFRDALAILFQQISTVQNIPLQADENIDALPELSSINFNIDENNDVIPYGDNEKYSIAMDSNVHSVDITAPSAFGALRAMQTLVQLVRQGRGFNYIPNFPIAVEDKPKFPHRGLLLDTAREYYRVSTIKNIIQFLGANKMNVLHWHITDDHAFSVECKKYPGLAKGSTFGGAFYTQEEVQEIVHLAARHGVRIIAEIGGPAHAGSWINDYHPDMITNCPQFSCHKAWGVTMNPTLDQTYEMLEDFFKEMAELFPDPYMHFGGDEATSECWSQNPGVTSWMSSNGMGGDYNKLMQHFETKFHSIASSIKRIGMRWEEVWSRPDVKQDWPIVVAWLTKPSEPWMNQMLARYNVSFLSYNGWYLNHNAGGVGCQSWSECYDKTLFNLPTNSSLWKRVLGGCTSAWEMSDAHFTGRDLWLRTTTLSEALWTEESVVANNRARKDEQVKPRLLEMCRHLMSTQFSSEAYKTRHPCWHLSKDYLDAKGQIDNQLLKEYSIREAQRDDLICTRVKNHFDPPNKHTLTCTTKNCIREKIGTTHHETQG